MLKLAIRPNSILIYRQKNKGSGGSSVTESSKENLSKKYSTGGLSESAKKQIKTTIANWSTAVMASQRLFSKGKERKRRYFVMITLTLPSKQIEDDETIKRKYLNVWLQRLRRVHKGINYLWVAETQKNGNIHFHIIVDRWVNYLWVSSTWNATLANGEYINLFAAKFGHRQPPTTKVTGQKNMKDPALYICKYISKDENTRKLVGHCWYCCDELKKIERVGLPNADIYEDTIVLQNSNKLVNVLYGEFSTAYYFKEPLCCCGVFDDILRIAQKDICLIYGELFQELFSCIPEDLPIVA